MKTNAVNKTIDINKVKIFRQAESKVLYRVVDNSKHVVDGTEFVVASRMDKPGFVRIPVCSLTEI